MAYAARSYLYLATNNLYGSISCLAGTWLLSTSVYADVALCDAFLSLVLASTCSSFSHTLIGENSYH